MRSFCRPFIIHRRRLLINKCHRKLYFVIVVVNLRRDRRPESSVVIDTPCQGCRGCILNGVVLPGRQTTFCSTDTLADNGRQTGKREEAGGGGTNERTCTCV